MPEDRSPAAPAADESSSPFQRWRVDVVKSEVTEEIVGTVLVPDPNGNLLLADDVKKLTEFLVGDAGCFARAFNRAEPTFTLRAQDALAPMVIGYWALKAEAHGVNPEKVEEARNIARAMQSWTGEKKLPD